MDEIPETLKAGFQHIRAAGGPGKAQILKAYAGYRPERGRKMLLSEFMALGLWQIRTVPEGFIGTREASTFALSANFLPHKRGLVADKLLFDAALRGLGFPVPEVQAVFGAKRLPPPIRALDHKGAVTRFLREHARYPLFGKPLAGENSDGALSIARYEPGADQLHMATGEAMALDEVVNMIAPAYYRRGYLFQSFIRQHPDLCSAIGQTVGTVRIITFLARATPRILGAFWKIPRAHMVADNLWRGGLIGAVQTETGRIGRVRAGTGPVARWHETHPDTHAPLGGLFLPDWPQTCRMVSDAATLFSGLPLVGWDVALSDTGPLIVEANTVPSLDLLQYASGTPALPPDLRAEITEEVARLKRQAKANRKERKADLRRKLRGHLKRRLGLGKRNIL